MHTLIDIKYIVTSIFFTGIMMSTACFGSKACPSVGDLCEKYGKYCGSSWTGNKRLSSTRYVKKYGADLSEWPSPRNKLDKCCQYHDWCLGTGGNTTKCDKTICECAKIEESKHCNPFGKFNASVCLESKKVITALCNKAAIESI